MRVTIPFTDSNDISETALSAKIPLSGSNGKIDISYSRLTPPSGAFVCYGFFGSPLPQLPSNVFALGHDTSTDQIMLWDGGKWRTVA